MATIDTAETFSQRYRHTYIEVQDKHENFPPFVCYVHEVSRAPGTVILLITRWDGEEKREDQINMDKHRITREFPEMGYVNHELTAYYLSRMPLRQWRRGFHEGVVQRTCLNTDEFIRTKLKVPSVHHYKFVQDVFNKTYRTPEEIISKMEAGEILGGAFNPRFAIITKIGTKYPLLAYKQYLVGHINQHGEAVIPSKVEHLIEDVSQYMAVKVG